MNRFRVALFAFFFLTFPITGSATDQRAGIQAVQACLSLLGYDVGAVDGVSGPRTKAAARRYLTDRFGTHYAQVPMTTTRAMFRLECDVAVQEWEQTLARTGNW